MRLDARLAKQAVPSRGVVARIASARPARAPIVLHTAGRNGKERIGKALCGDIRVLDVTARRPICARRGAPEAARRFIGTFKYVVEAPLKGRIETMRGRWTVAPRLWSSLSPSSKRLRWTTSPGAGLRSQLSVPIGGPGIPPPSGGVTSVRIARSAIEARRNRTSPRPTLSPCRSLNPSASLSRPPRMPQRREPEPRGSPQCLGWYRKRKSIGVLLGS
jgi:hypothetical protein